VDIDKAEVTKPMHGICHEKPEAITPQILWDFSFPHPIPLPSLVQIHPVSGEIYPKMSSRLITIPA